MGPPLLATAKHVMLRSGQPGSGWGESHCQPNRHDILGGGGGRVGRLLARHGGGGTDRLVGHGDDVGLPQLSHRLNQGRGGERRQVRARVRDDERRSRPRRNETSGGSRGHGRCVAAASNRSSAEGKLGEGAWRGARQARVGGVATRRVGCRRSRKKKKKE